MKQAGISGKWREGKHSVVVNVPMMLFKEDKTHIAYIPVLDISGYGNTEKEAKNSLWVALDEYFSYTTNKNTLFADLKAQGWTITKKTKPFIAPEISQLINQNEYLQNIVDSRQYRVDRIELPMPQYVAC